MGTKAQAFADVHEQSQQKRRGPQQSPNAAGAEQHSHQWQLVCSLFLSKKADMGVKIWQRF